MAQPKPDDKATLEQVLQLISQLSASEQQQLVEELKAQWLRSELAKAEECIDRGALIDGEEVLRRLRERNSTFEKKA